MVRMAARISADCIKSPDLRAILALETQRGKRNRYFHSIAPISDLSCRIPDSIPAWIFSALRFDLVKLHSQTGNNKVQAPSIVVESVEDEGYPIVPAQSISVSEVGAYG